MQEETKLIMFKSISHVNFFKMSNTIIDWILQNSICLVSEGAEKQTNSKTLLHILANKKLLKAVRKSILYAFFLCI